MNAKKLLLILGGICALLIVFVIVGRVSGFLGGRKATVVETGQVSRQTITEIVTASGKIFPEREVKISPEIYGEIIALNYEEGDSVKAGDLLVEIQPDLYVSAVNRAEATLNQAKAGLAQAKERKIQAEAALKNTKKQYERNKSLFKEGVIAQQEYDNALAAFEQADAELRAAEQGVQSAQFSVKGSQATLKEARANLARTKIYAPINGIISWLDVEVGERVVGTTQMPGTEMLVISNFNTIEIQVDVSENDIFRVGIGDSVDIEVDAYLDKTFSGVVTQIASAASPEQQALSTEQVTNFKVVIVLNPQSYAQLNVKSGHASPFKPGMSASVDIKTERAENVTAAPIQSVTIREDEEDKDEVNEVVYVVQDDGTVQERIVETGIQNERYIHIKEGLEVDETIVTGPFRVVSKKLADGDAVQKEEGKGAGRTPQPAEEE